MSRLVETAIGAAASAAVAALQSALKPSQVPAALDETAERLRFDAAGLRKQAAIKARKKGQTR
jgi:hypothetical protein